LIDPEESKMSDTLFEKIVAREIPADIVYEDDELLAFRDIEPQAPVHVLIIPKKRIPTLNDLEPSHAELVGRMVLAASRIAKDEGIAEDGYRLNLNCNRAGRTVGVSHPPASAGWAADDLAAGLVEDPGPLPRPLTALRKTESRGSGNERRPGLAIGPRPFASSPWFLTDCRGCRPIAKSGRKDGAGLDD
jgi:histidine triad (HIT) family protein